MARSRHTIEQKLSALRMMKEETHTWKEIMEAHGVSRHTIQVWKVKFDTGVFCNTNAHNYATKSTELCQLSFSVSIMHV